MDSRGKRWDGMFLSVEQAGEVERIEEKEEAKMEQNHMTRRNCK